MDHDALISVYDAETEVQAMLYRTVLEEAGIDVIERPMETAWLETVKLRALHSQLLVRASDAQRARELVESFHDEAESGELAVTDEDVPPDGA